MLISHSQERRARGAEPADEELVGGRPQAHGGRRRDRREAGVDEREQRRGRQEDEELGERSPGGHLEHVRRIIKLNY